MARATPRHRANLIELECPGCQALLELDRGFAGGVCRCYGCGTMMTVPSNASEQAERLVRPETPGGGRTRRPGRPDRPARSARPDRPGGPAGRTALPPLPPQGQTQAQTPSSAGGAPRGSRPALPASRSRSAPPPTALPTEDVDVDVYTTESGRVIQVDRRRGIPTAQKRKVARYATYLVFGLIIAAVLGACAFAAMVLMEQHALEQTERSSPGIVETFAFDPSVNPFTLDHPNVLGLPLRTRTVVVVDASAASEAWLDDARAALHAGLIDRGGATQLELLYATDGGILPLHDGFGSTSGLMPQQLERLHEQVAAAGETDLPPAVYRALTLAPTHLILVTGRRLEAAELREIRRSLQGIPAIVVDVVALGIDSVDLEDLARDHQGRYVRLPAARLSDWRAEAAASDVP